MIKSKTKILFCLFFLINNCISLITFEKSFPKKENKELIPFGTPSLKIFQDYGKISWTAHEIKSNASNSYSVEIDSPVIKMERCIDIANKGIFFFPLQEKGFISCDKIKFEMQEKMKIFPSLRGYSILPELKIILDSNDLDADIRSTQMLCQCKDLLQEGEFIAQISQIKKKPSKGFIEDKLKLLIKTNLREFLLNGKIDNDDLILKSERVLDFSFENENIFEKKEIKFQPLDINYTILINQGDRFFLYNIPDLKKTVHIYIRKEKQIITVNPNGRLLLFLLPITLPLDYYTFPLQIAFGIYVALFEIRHVSPF